MTSPQSAPKERQDTVIIALGNTLRRDDGVGPLALDACRYEPVPGCDLVEIEGGPDRITDAWRNRKLAIVLDALCTGEPAGTVHDYSVSMVDPASDSENATNPLLAAVAKALEVGRELDHLPEALRLLGIEPGDLKRGFGLSPAVAASMDELVGRVRSAVASASAAADDPGASDS